MTDASGEPAASRKRAKLVVRLASLVFVALCLAFVVHLLIRDWPETVEALRHASLVWLLPAAVCAVGAMFLLAWRWGAAIIAVGGERARLPPCHQRILRRRSGQVHTGRRLGHVGTQ